MSVSINFSFTQAGQAAVFNAQKTGTSLALTHIQLGSGNKVPAGTELRLVTPQQTAAIAGGSQVTPTQIRMSALFGGATSFAINEIAVWAGDPALAGSILVAYWSQASGTLAYKSAGVDFVFSHDMVLNAAVPAGSLTILADQAQSAMLAALAAHEAKPDPHPQYLHRAAPWKDAMRVATTATLAATYANGAAGVGATLTATAVGALLIDGVNPVAGDTVLVKNQTAPAQNGIYTVTTPGTATAAWVLTRLSFADHPLELAGAVTTVDQGATNGGRTFSTTFKSTDLIGTSACDWFEQAMVGKHTHGIADVTGLSEALATKATPVEVIALIEARVGDYVIDTGTANACLVALVPPVTAYAAKTAFTVKVAAANTGPVTLNAGGGARPLVREDGKPMAPGDLAAGVVVTVVYDVASASFRSTEMVPSQADERIALHEAKPDPHPQYLHRNAPWKDAVRVATTATLAATYANGTAGVGATLTATAVGALLIDGVSLVPSDRVLVKNQTAPAQNGIYTVTTPGTATAAWVLRRAPYLDHPGELAGAVTTVDQGTVNGGRTFTTSFKTTDVIGTSACPWVEMLYNSGTWDISITGNAATASSAPLVSVVPGYRQATDLPKSFALGIQAGFVGPAAAEGGWPNYGSVLTMRTYSAGGGSLQLHVPYGTSFGKGLQVRFGDYNLSSGNSWTAWKTLLASDNFNDYAPTKTGAGASGTWGISVTGNAGNGVPVGTVIEYPSLTTPAGYLKANGAAVSRTAYAALFAVVGTTFGAGDGTTTFNLPDRRDRMAIGAEGLYALGAKGGNKDAVVVEHQHNGGTTTNGWHSHSLTTYFDGGYGNPFRVTGDDGSYNGLTMTNVPGVEPSGDHSHSFTTSWAGQSGINANLPPYLAMSFYIKF